jgi:hypothetical protein
MGCRLIRLGDGFFASEWFMGDGWRLRSLGRVISNKCTLDWPYLSCQSKHRGHNCDDDGEPVQGDGNRD